MRKAIANQGEIAIAALSELPKIATKPFGQKNGKGWIISHSESGHHHILGGDCEVMERVDVPTGSRILYAIVKDPTRLFQDATVPHKPIELDAGIYEFRIKREFDPFAEQVRRVAD